LSSPNIYGTNSLSNTLDKPEKKMPPKKPQLSTPNDCADVASDIVIPARVLNFLLRYKPSKQSRKKAK
jgi:hypothetical protein